jgi:hypothetical protein
MPRTRHSGTGAAADAAVTARAVHAAPGPAGKLEA